MSYTKGRQALVMVLDFLIGGLREGHLKLKALQVRGAEIWSAERDVGAFATFLTI